MSKKAQKVVEFADLKTKVSIGKIGKSRLADPEEVDQAQNGLDVLAPGIETSYCKVANYLADPEKFSWARESVDAELEALAEEAILRTGSLDSTASTTARRARELAVLAVGRAMFKFPRTILGLTYLANHAIKIGLLRQPGAAERGLTVDLPTGDSLRPFWVKLLCPFPKSVDLIGAYTAMAAEANEMAHKERGAKLAALRSAYDPTHLIAVLEGVEEGEAICFVPKTPKSEALYYKINADNGYVTVTEAAGSYSAESSVGFWIPLESIEKGYFSRKITEGLEQDQIDVMTGIRYRLRDGLVYARAKNGRRRPAVFIEESTPAPAAVPAPPPIPSTVPIIAAEPETPFAVEAPVPEPEK